MSLDTIFTLEVVLVVVLLAAAAGGTIYLWRSLSSEPGERRTARSVPWISLME